MNLNPLNTLAQIIPNLVVSRRVMDKMAAASRRYIADETGEAMVGLVVPGKNTNGVPTLYVLDTISPDERTVVRHAHTFQQGDELQDELIWWLQENWRVYREMRRNSYGSALQAKWDVPLRYLGDWHKQPGFMIQPSSGDRMTALSWILDEENGMEFLLAPIVTLGHPSTTSNPYANANFVTLPHGNATDLRVDFWYIERTIGQFLPIIPAIYPEDQLPGLPDYPWHLVDEKRFKLETGMMTQDGLFTSLVLWNADTLPPLEICFMTGRVGADKVLIIVTQSNYPATAPTARVAPFIHMEPDDDMFTVFEELWEQSEPVADPPDWKWSAEHHLLDYIHALEDHLGIERVAPLAAPEPVESSETASESISIPVQIEDDDAS
jgi:hypothetical protein